MSSAPEGAARGPLVSVIVPVLDEARELPGLLGHLAATPGRFEYLVADGGSSDGSAAIVRAHPLGVRLLESARGRAGQLNSAAAGAGGDLLVFLHADTRLPRTAYQSLRLAHADPAVTGGNFALSFGGEDRFSRFLTRFYAAQRRLGTYYGDSAIWVRRSAFAELGGFRPLAIMDDYDFARRLERLARERGGRTLCLPGPAVTSPRRWRALGLPRTLASWGLIRWLWLAGVPAERLARLYPKVR